MSSSSLESYLDKIIILINEKLEKNQDIKFPCKYMVFHQAKSFCKNCENFICDKCIKKHDTTHKILSLQEAIDSLTSNISLYKDLSSGKFPKEEKCKNITEEKIILDEKIEQNFMEEIDELINKINIIKKKILKFFEFRKNLLKKYNSEENNIVYEDDLMQKILKPEKLEIKPLVLKEVKDIHDIIKFETNNNTLFKSFLSFSNELDFKNKEIIENNKYIKKKKKKDSMKIFERINLKTNELNLIMSDIFIHKIKNFINNEMPLIDDKIEKTENVFKNVICEYLKISNDEYNNELNNTEVDDEPKKIVEIPKEIIVEVEKKVEVKVPIQKSEFNIKDLKINNIDIINIIGSNKNKENNENEEKMEDNNNNNNDDHIIENNEINEQENNDNNNEQNEENDKVEEINKNENKNKNPKTSGLRRATAIKKNTELDAYSMSVLSLQNVKDIYKGTYNEAKAIIITRDNKFLMDTNEEIEETTKTCQEKLNNLNLAKSKENFNLEKELSKFSWKERNLFELIYPIEDQKLLCLYNPYINKVEEVEIETNEKFPINCAIYFKLPYCFISGGKFQDEDGNFEEIDTFYTIRREGPKIYEKLLLPEMLESKTNHCLFEIPYINSICALGGKNSKDVEIFDLTEKTWQKYPDLNMPREGSTCCVINNTFIYCFFGYDDENATYLTSIEKFDLLYKKEWELLNPYGNKSFMKKKMSGCVKYRQNFEEKIFILGGINVLNNESKDCLVYNEKNNTIEKNGDISLPIKSCFNSCNFIQLPNGIFYNLNIDFQLIQYDPLIKYFFGIREK